MDIDLGLEASKDFVIGIDIGGTNTKFGIINRRGEIVKRGNILTKSFLKASELIDKLYDQVHPMIDEMGGSKYLKGIGVGVPNANFFTGEIEYAPNLPWEGVTPLSKIVTARFQKPSVIMNDANAAAEGERMYGAARGLKDFVMITLGTGLGSAVVTNGQLVLGHDGYAGEIGHTIAIPNGRDHWTTDLKGSLESYVSATGIKLTALEFLEEKRDIQSVLRKISRDKINSKVVYEAAKEGDPLALEVFEYTGKILGRSLANVVMTLSPEAIVLFGGVVKASELILPAAKKSMEENLLPLYKNKVRLMVTELEGADASILGASLMVWDIKAP